MNADLRRQIIDEFGHMNITWTASPVHGNETADLKWFEVAALDGNQLCLGLSENACWVAASRRSVAELNSKENYVFFLRVLESSLSVIQEKIAEGLVSRKLPESWAGSFPFEEIITGALESGSEYWVALALGWVMECPHSARIQESLLAVIEKGPTQKLRHTAKRLAYRQGLYQK